MSEAPLLWRRIKPGTDGRSATKECPVAVAGEWQYLWGDWFREDIHRVFQEKPNASVRLICRKNGQSFGGGFLDGYEDRTVVELYY